MKNNKCFVFVLAIMILGLVIPTHGIQAQEVSNDSNVWAWGNNFSGQLGCGDKVDKNVPVLTADISEWKTVYCRPWSNIKYR